MGRKDGGPAFPVSDAFVDTHEGGHGMSLRDYFAAKIVAGWNNTYECLAVRRSGLDPNAHNTIAPPWAIAMTAYEIADAMLAERESTS